MTVLQVVKGLLKWLTEWDIVEVVELLQQTFFFFLDKKKWGSFFLSDFKVVGCFFFFFASDIKYYVKYNPA